MSEVFILGAYSTAVGRFPDKGLKDLTRDAYLGALADASLEDPAVIGGAWFANMMMDFWGQPYVKGQLCVAPLMSEGLFPRSAATINVEGGCATGSLAFHGAVMSVLAKQSDVALAIGVEKMHDASRPHGVLQCIGNALDWLDPESWQSLYRKTAEESGSQFETGPERSIAIDIYALWARSHMHHFGTTVGQIAAAAAKNHTNSVANPRAQYRFPLSVEEVLSDRVVSGPLTRAMCAPIGDGAAAVLVCSRKYLETRSPEAKARAVPIRALEIAGGQFNSGWTSDRAPVVAARRAYSKAQLTPGDIGLVELHDASSFAEIHLVEDLGFCERGQGGPFTASGATRLDGSVPVNPSGGLVSRGHPIGATGLMMLNEICVQLRGEAGGNQIDDLRYALAENGGGIVGNDVAVCSISILERPMGA